MLICRLHKFITLNFPESESKINLIIKQIAFLRTNRFLHGLQSTDKSRITDSRMYGKSYKSRTEHSRTYGFGSTLRNTDFLIFSSNQMNGYHQVNVSQSGQRDHRCI